MEGAEVIAVSGLSSSFFPRGAPLAQITPLGHMSSLPNIRPSNQSSVGESFSAPEFSTEPAHLVFAANDHASLEPMKKKRGRPRKYSPSGEVSLALSPLTAPVGTLSTSLKRGRGRPPGTGRKQLLATLGQWMTESAGLAFAPYIITVAEGEDAVAKLLSFSQQRQRVVCILSGTGIISAVTLRQPASSGGSLTFEGRYEIVCMSGSYLLDENGGARSRIGGVNVSLSSVDGRVIGGVAGKLIAATPLHVVLCTFVYAVSKGKQKPTSCQLLEFNPSESDPKKSLSDRG